ncbi:MAG TPA: hypothetical protein VEF76_11590 [Patescibacteria group bacterium]|nr:hypothetical protein [Patescibacteria group bacterium]
MTDVQKNKSTKINSREEALALYTPPPASFANKIGVEVEMPLYKTGAVKPQLPKPDEMQALQETLKAKGFDAQLEPSGVVEYAGPPFDLKDSATLISQMKTDVAIFDAAIAEAGFQRSPFSILPTTTKDEALGNMVSRERLQASLKAMQEIFDENTLRLPMLTSSVQTSFSPEDPEQMFRMMYRAYALSPLLMAATNSSSGFVVNEDTRLDYIPRAKYYLGYGDAGGVSPAFLNASNGDELIRNQVDAVFKAPMHFAYAEDGSIISSAKDDRLTFEKLIERGLNTQSNYELAETFLYNDVKIANLRDETGAVVGKRMEVRGADSGCDQPLMAVLLTAALIPDGRAAEQFDALLRDYGFTGNPKQDAALFVNSRAAAVDNGGRFMDVAFGTGRLMDFAADVAGIIVNAWDGQVQAKDMERLVDVLLTGNTDAKIFAEKFPKLADVNAFLQAANQNTTQPAVQNKPKPRAV